MIPTIMTQIIGTEVLAPPELAIGAEVAMATAWVTPRTAEAAPATCGAWAAGECVGVAEDEFLNRHQDQEPCAGEDQGREAGIRVPQEVSVVAFDNWEVMAVRRDHR